MLLLAFRTMEKFWLSSLCSYFMEFYWLCLGYQFHARHAGFECWVAIWITNNTEFRVPVSEIFLPLCQLTNISVLVQSLRLTTGELTVQTSDCQIHRALSICGIRLTWFFWSISYGFQLRTNQIRRIRLPNPLKSWHTPASLVDFCLYLFPETCMGLKLVISVLKVSFQMNFGLKRPIAGPRTPSTDLFTPQIPSVMKKIRLCERFEFI